jgi:hypothetical protein
MSFARLTKESCASITRDTPTRTVNPHSASDLLQPLRFHAQEATPGFAEYFPPCAHNEDMNSQILANQLEISLSHT